MADTNGCDPQLRDARRPCLVVVDDNPDDVYLLARVLKRAGLVCDLIHAPDRGTLRAALNRDPDIVIVDFRLPGLPLDETVDTLSEARVNCPVMVLSGSDDPRLRAECRKLGIGLCASKDNLNAAVKLVERVLTVRFRRSEIRD